jgi:hypothetical protein
MEAGLGEIFRLGHFFWRHRPVLEKIDTPNALIKCDFLPSYTSFDFMC